MFIITKTFTDDVGHLFTKVIQSSIPLPEKHTMLCVRITSTSSKAEVLRTTVVPMTMANPALADTSSAMRLKSTILPNTPRMNSFFLLFCSESIGLVKENRNG